MKTKRILLGVAALLVAICSSASAQNTVVTYQGRVTDNGTNFNGNGQFKFALVTSTNANRTATATANPPSGGFITVIAVTSGGNGYVTPPTVTIAGGGGSGAVATANISSGVVTSITVNNPGSSYASTPTILLSAPPESLTFVTYWSNDGTSSAGSQPTAAVSASVANGLFTVPLGDATLPNMTALSAALFQQTNLQLRIWFNDGVNGFAALSPLQNLTAAPYANYAYAATTLTTSSNQPLNFSINGNNVLRITSGFDSGNSSFTANSVGGYSGNVISNGFFGGFIGGGGNSTFPNHVGANYASVLGGFGNTASGSGSTAMGAGTTASSYASTAMGTSTTASGAYSTAMGAGTTASGDTSTAMGASTTASGTYSTAMGAVTTANGLYSTAMGYSTAASGGYSTAMGYRAKANHLGTFVWADSQNIDFASTAVNQFCVRAGGGVLLDGDIQIGTGGGDYQHLQLGGGNSSGFLYGSFPKYGDGINLGYNYYADAGGGNHVINTGGATSRLTTGYGFVGIYIGGVNVAPDTQRLLANSTGVTVNGTFNNSSDRNVKQAFAAVSPAQMLEKVTRLPISEWSYKADATTRHVGPVAQDFYSVFNIGTDDKHIAPIDEGGVALAAIQGLNEKVEARSQQSEDRLQKLAAENQALKQRLERLEQLLNQKY